MTSTTTSRRPKRSILARFAGVGTINTVIDFVLYAILCLVGVPALLANLISTSSGLAFSYWGNRRFTFAVRDARTLREVLLFLLGTGAGLWFLQPVLILLITSGFAPLHPPAILAVAVPKIVAIGAGVVWNFWFYSRIVFRTAVSPVRTTALRDFAQDIEEN